MHLTKKQIDRQSHVDNAIYNCLVAVTEDLKLQNAALGLKWDIDLIAEVRNQIFSVLEEQYYLSDEQEQEFYPFIITE